MSPINPLKLSMKDIKNTTGDTTYPCFILSFINYTFDINVNLV